MCKLTQDDAIMWINTTGVVWTYMHTQYTSRCTQTYGARWVVQACAIHDHVYKKTTGVSMGCEAYDIHHDLYQNIV